MDDRDQTTSDLPLCVDLDGTLCKTDLLLEALLKLLKSDPFAVFKLVWWLSKGKARFKDEIFSRVEPDPTTLPYNEELVELLRGEATRGRQILLVTATPKRVADKVAAQFDFFSTVIASDRETNLAGAQKARVLAERFGEGGFAYTANDRVDLPVWRQAGEASVVHAASGLAEKVARHTPVKDVLRVPRKTLRLIIKEVRVHQWAKNVLIFAPLLLSQQVGDFERLASCIVAFLAFTLVSSSVYITNDLLDLESDRRHPDNKKRPFASGDLHLKWGFYLAPLLFAGGLAAASTLSLSFYGVLLGYFILTTLYSLHLKEVVLADVLILASLYAWRVFAGSVAADIPLSTWFLAFSGFLFLSLALVKRSSELILTRRTRAQENPRRGYWVGDLEQLIAFGSSSGYMAVLVLALYINSEEVVEQYASPRVLWLVCPFLLYWISRMWLKAHRGKMHSDPLVFAMKDRVSYIMLLVISIIWWTAVRGV